MADPSEMLICSNQSFPEGYLCCNPSLFISQPAKAPKMGAIEESPAEGLEMLNDYAGFKRRYSTMLKFIKACGLPDFAVYSETEVRLEYALVR